MTMYRGVIVVSVMMTGVVSAQSPMVLNEYNGVGSAKVLADEGRDTHFGQVAGNGGNWIELVVTADRLDARGWRLEWSENSQTGAIILGDAPLWQSLRAGTILTFIDRGTTDGGLDTDTSFTGPQGDDWWVNVCTRDRTLVTSEGPEPGKFSTGNDDFTLTIRDAKGTVVFGPAGEGAPVWTGGGVNSQEAGALHAQPSPTVTGESAYDDVTWTSFGSPNTWTADEREMTQDFGPLRRGEMRGGMEGERDGGAGATTQASAVAGEKAVAWDVKTLGTVDVPGWTCEIVAWCESEKLLLSTNGSWKTLDVFHVGSFDPPALAAIDFDAEEPGAQGIWTGGHDPTSVAVHPTLSIAFVTALSSEPMQRGWVHAYDLRRDTLGKLIFSQRVGFHPDSLAITPDGSRLVIANEGEGSPDTPGSVGVLTVAGVTPDRRPYHEGAGELAYVEVAGLAHALETPAGDVEPEYVAVDARSRFAAVSCQENDAVALVDLRGSTPTLAGIVWLPSGSEPDGVALIDGIEHAGVPGVVLGVTEEGKFDPWKGQWLGNAVSFHWLDPDALDRPPVLLARLDVNRLVDPSGDDRKRRDPESIRFARAGDRVLAVVGVERADRLIVLDCTDMARPRRITLAKVGEAPEGLIVIPDPARPDGLLAITGDEGKADGPGTISVVRIAPAPAATVSASP